MLELLFLLLPISMLYGWYMGRRSAKKDQEHVQNDFSRNYVTGLNFFLSNQQDKAVDLFLSMLQKQESENHIAREPQFESELTLGNLFRSRGELDRALRIHEGLVNNPNYSFEQKLLAKQQLAMDFFKAGFYDRAEQYYITLVDEPEFAQHSLLQLIRTYEKTRDWKKTVNVAEKLLKIDPDTDRTMVAHLYCEDAQSYLNEDNVYLSLLEKALSYSPNCTRASILLGNFYYKNSQFEDALSHYENVLNQDPDYISEVLENIKSCYIQLGQVENFEFFLIKANQIQHDSSIDLAIAEIVEKKDGIAAAQSVLYQQLKQHSSLITFQRFIYYQMNNAEQGGGRDSLVLLHDMVGEHLKKSSRYKCRQCGYQSYRLAWHCPSCHNWETIKPIQHIV